MTIFCIQCTNCGFAITSYLQGNSRYDGYILCNECLQKLKELLGELYLQVSAQLQIFGQKRAKDIEETNK